MRLESILLILAYLNCLKASTEDQLKSALFPILELNQRPKGGVISETMRNLYKRQKDYYFDTASIPLPGTHSQSANTIRSFPHKETPIDGRFIGHHKFRLNFDIIIPKNEMLKAAELKLTRVILNTNHYQRILVNDIIKPGKKGKYGPITRVIDSKLVDVTKNKTLNLDVLPAVQRWIENPKQNYGLLIMVYDLRDKKTIPVRHIRLRRDLEEDWFNYEPLLLTYTDDGRNKQRSGSDMTKMERRKRAARRGPRKPDPCKRRSMFVDFRDVGWSDWIVAPTGFNAFYCSGECEYPMAEHMNTTNHAIVQSLMNSAQPFQVPKPCCVPTELSSMSILYVEGPNKAILKNYKDMVVNGCGCR